MEIIFEDDKVRGEYIQEFHDKVKEILLQEKIPFKSLDSEIKVDLYVLAYIRQKVLRVEASFYLTFCKGEVPISEFSRVSNAIEKSITKQLAKEGFNVGYVNCHLDGRSCLQGYKEKIPYKEQEYIAEVSVYASESVSI